MSGWVAVEDMPSPPRRFLPVRMQRSWRNAEESRRSQYRQLHPGMQVAPFFSRAQAIPKLLAGAHFTADDVGKILALCKSLGKMLQHLARESSELRLWSFLSCSLTSPACPRVWEMR